MLASLSAIVFSITNFQLPIIVDNTFNIIGNLTIPLVIFSLGIYFNPKILKILPTFSVVFIRMFIGLIAGFVGAGGGFLIIPALVLFAGLQMRVAIGTSLMIIALQSLLGFAGDISRGTPVDWFLLGLVATIAIVGIIVGSVIAHKINEQKLKTAFGWFVLIMGVVILFEQTRHLSF